MPYTAARALESAQNMRQRLRAVRPADRESREQLELVRLDVEMLAGWLASMPQETSDDRTHG